MNKIMLTLALAAAALPAAAVDFNDMILSPAQGTVAELDVVTFTFPNAAYVEINSASDITATKDGELIEGLKVKESDNTLAVTFPERQTEMGTYLITIGTEAIYVANASYTSFLDNPEPITATYVIGGEAEAVDFRTYTIDPANRTMLGSFDTMTITFDNLAGLYSTGAPIVTVGDKELSAFEEDFDISISGNTLTLTLAETVTAEEPTPVKILFYAGSLGGVSEAGEEDMNANPIQIDYTVAPPVVYDLSLEFNSPTKPNADGEISADKQLDSFFFMIEGTGYLPGGDDTPMVTMKSDDGSYEKAAHIQKAFGFNSAYSYFSVPFNAQPRYNGRYVISFPEGVFGDELFVTNHGFGVSNKAFELEYILVDGIQTSVKAVETGVAADEIYNLQGVRMTSDKTSLPAGVYVVKANGKTSKITVK